MAKPTRRTVLRTGVLLAAAAAPVAAAEQAMSAVAGGMASGLRRSTFAPHVRSSFRLVRDGAIHRAVLTEVSDLDVAPGAETKFRMLFKVKGSSPESGIYRLRHARVAAMDLFLTPIGGSADVYEAVVDAR